MEMQLGLCRIRHWRVRDDAALVRHGDNRNVWIQLMDRFPHPYTAEDARAWIRLCRATRKPTHFAIDVNGEAVGGIGYQVREDVFRCTASIGYWLGEAFWGRGIVTEALRAMVRHIFESHADVLRIEAQVFSTNAASMRVLEKNGFQREGVLRRAVVKGGRTFDVHVFARLR